MHDGTTFYSLNGRFLFKADLGMMFPEEGPIGGPHLVLAAVADEEGRAVIRQVVLPEEAAAVKPLPLTRKNLARAANVLVGQPYGWGGMYENRDCSAMIRDLFAPFGIWLPRNSKDQAREGGRWIDLSMLKAVEKERVIRRDGVPYLTLLYMKGHIMLYMVCMTTLCWYSTISGASDERKGEIATKQIVGQAAITTYGPAESAMVRGRMDTCGVFSA